VDVAKGGSSNRAGTVLLLISIIELLDGDFAAADTFDPGDMAVVASISLGDSTCFGLRVDGNTAAFLGLWSNAVASAKFGNSK
jgi:hypothetical protein